HFSQIRYHRNNNFYKLLIDICEMIFDELITTSQKGETDFKDFIQDKQMAKLYEKFILNFYKKEFTELTVHSPNFSWDKDVDFEHKGDDLLPIMKTDIVLQNKDKQLIIDAKYYADALISRNDIEVKKYRSFHLYQIFSYINNSKFDGEKAGMLLYPVVDNEIDAVSKIQGKEIYIQTLNLNTDWKNIERRLMEIARKSFPSLPG
ncbi:MAG: 5-methylcytosine-specific restriction endonuclease system specificity protein McrC, partial [bacterium]